jgi:uncharacterized protein (DUF58 family)
MNRKLFLLLFLSTGLLIAGLVTRSSDLAWMAVPFLVYIIIGVWRSKPVAALHLTAERRVSRELSEDGAPCVRVEVTVRNEGDAIDRLQLADPSLLGVTLLDGQFAQWFSLQKGESGVLRYGFQERRGSYEWKMIRAVASDPFDLIETAQTIPAKGAIQIQPERDTLRQLPLHPHSTLHSAGSIPAHLGGSGTDFWGVREYQPGDSLRWLDWRLTARHPHQFFTKEFEQEEIADIGLIVDARSKMDLEIDGNSMFEHMVRATASLAEVFLHQSHRVSLMVYGRNLRTVFPGYGKVQLQRIFRCLAEARVESKESGDSLQFVPLEMFSSQSLLVVFSALSQNDWPFFPRLRASGYQGLLVSPDPFDFGRNLFESEIGDRVEDRLAIRTSRVERRLELRHIAMLQIPVIDWKVDQPLYPLIRNALNRTRGQRER